MLPTGILCAAALLCHWQSAILCKHCYACQAQLTADAYVQFIAKTKEAVTATCCYTKRQLSWEIAEAGQKSKIEIQWDDITNLKVTPMVCY